jgi:hypothetical protein
MGNQNPYIEKGQTTQWPKEKVQKDKQRSTRHTHKTKDRVTRTPLKTGGDFRYTDSDYPFGIFKLFFLRSGENTFKIGVARIKYSTRP